MDDVDGGAGAIEADGTVGRDGKDLDEFSDSVACVGLGMVCFPVFSDCTGLGIDCFPVFSDCTGSGTDCFPISGDCSGLGVDCFAVSSDVVGRELL